VKRPPSDGDFARDDRPRQARQGLKRRRHDVSGILLRLLLFGLVAALLVFWVAFLGAAGKRVSLGEMFVALPHVEQGNLKVAVNQLVQQGKVVRSDGLYELTPKE